MHTDVIPANITILEAKDALYWWALRLVDDFQCIWLTWHAQVSAHVPFVATKLSLNSRSWEKNTISEPELALIYRFIMEQDSGMANLKQHWAAILLAWTTGARPGSFTVAEGYEKGASIGEK